MAAGIYSPRIEFRKTIEGMDTNAWSLVFDSSVDLADAQDIIVKSVLIKVITVSPGDTLAFGAPGINIRNNGTLSGSPTWNGTSFVTQNTAGAAVGEYVLLKAEDTDGRRVDKIYAQCTQDNGAQGVVLEFIINPQWYINSSGEFKLFANVTVP